MESTRQSNTIGLTLDTFIDFAVSSHLIIFCVVVLRYNYDGAGILRLN